MSRRGGPFIVTGPTRLDGHPRPSNWARDALTILGRYSARLCHGRDVRRIRIRRDVWDQPVFFIKDVTLFQRAKGHAVS